MVRHHLVHEPDAECLVGADRGAGEVHLERLALPHWSRQPLSPAEAGNDPEVDLWLAEGGGLRREPEVTRHRQLAAAAERKRVNRRDRHSPGRLHRAHQTVGGLEHLPSLLVGPHLRELLDVGPGGERKRVRRRDHERPRLAVHLLPHLAQLAQELRRERICGRAVEPGDRHAVVAGLEQDGLALLALVGTRVGEEALAGRLAEPSLRHQAPQDQRRLKPLAPLGRGPLERLQHGVESRLVGASERPRQDAGAGHHPDVDVLDPGHALLEHQAGLHERLQRVALHQRGGGGPGINRAHRTPSRSSGRGCRPPPAPSSASGRRSGPRSSPAGARPRAARCRGRAGR